jgi:HAD superfamily hydrolase (TIGR01490 family)
LYKEFLLEPFKGYIKDDFDNLAYKFYNEIIKKRINKAVLEKYYHHKSSGDMVIIASGGFDIYLKYFEQEYNADMLISTKLDFEGEYFSGKILGEEVLSENKAHMVKVYLDNIQVDWKSSFVYSDHMSDIPLFNLVGNKFLVDIGQDKSWVSSDFKIV